MKRMVGALGKTGVLLKQSCSLAGSSACRFAWKQGVSKCDLREPGHAAGPPCSKEMWVCVCSADSGALS